MITKDQLAIGVAAVVGAVVGIFAGQERPVHEFWSATFPAVDFLLGAGSWLLAELFDFLWRLVVVVCVIDAGLMLTYRWSSGMTRPMLCLLSTEIFHHYTRAVYVIVDATLGYCFPEHQKDREAFLIQPFRSARG